MNIVIISGSPRKKSITCRVAFHLRDLLRKQHIVELVDLREHSLPPIQTVFSTEEKTPQQYLPLRKTMFAADGFIFVSPEYNGGYSSIMKNLFDHFPKSAYARKAVGIVTASDGIQGGIRAAMQLQLLVCALGALPSPRMLITPEVDKKFDEQGKLLDPEFNKNVESFLNEYVWIAEALYQQKNKN